MASAQKSESRSIFEKVIQESGTENLKIYLMATLRKIQADLRSVGVNIRSVERSSWEFFESLEKDRQINIGDKIIRNAETVSEIIEQRIDISKNDQILKFFLHKHRLSVNSDFSQVISNEDVIEAYDPGHVQLFRNFRFLEITDYDLLRIESTEWQSLFGRDSGIIHELINGVQIALSPATDLYRFKIEPHITTELLTERNQDLLVQQKFIAPVFSIDNGACLGIISNMSVEPVQKPDSNLDHLR